MIKRLFILLISILLHTTISSSCSKDKSSDLKVVINEVMPKNTTTVADQNGEFDDWIELYNNTNIEIDLTGYYLSDNDENNTKWQFPAGTKIAAKGYLIVWADNDTEQAGLHANFKLSADGERVVLSNPQMVVIDQVKFGGQAAELSYSRIPNGTGKFSWKQPTFSAANGQ
jgi:hypothetical protein